MHVHFGRYGRDAGGYGWANHTHAHHRSDDTLTISMVKAAARGEEVFNTFGKHSNGTLLHRYGFAEWDNDLVTVQIDAATVDAAFDGERVVAAAAAALKQPWAEDDYTFELDPDGTVDAELLLVLRCAPTCAAVQWTRERAEGYVIIRRDECGEGASAGMRAPRTRSARRGRRRGRARRLQHCTRWATA